jgi:hypothetical protein
MQNKNSYLGEMTDDTSLESQGVTEVPEDEVQHLTDIDVRSDSILFFAEFIDGYSFRNSVEYLKATNKKGSFVFKQDYIMYAQDNVTGTVLNVMFYYASEMSRYIFNSEEKEEIVGMDLGHLRSVTKPIGKKDSVCLFRLKNDPLFYIQIISQNNRSANRSNLNAVRPVAVDLKVFEVAPYSRGDVPNCIIPASEFAKTCNAINAIKCTHASIKGYQQGVQIKGIIGNSLVSRCDSYGYIEQTTRPTLDLGTLSNIRTPVSTGPVKRGPRLVIDNSQGDEIKVATATIKALAKLNNLSTQGMVKVYIEPNRPVKLSTNIGNYGRLLIYLQEPKQDTAATVTPTGLGMHSRLPAL